MKCPYCHEDLPEDSLFCPFCGHRIEVQVSDDTEAKEEVQIPLSERDRVTSQQHYFDEDYGYSEDNPLVVSSVAVVGYYLAAFRTKDGKAFTWKREPFAGIPYIDKYNLFLDGELYTTIYFNHAGNDTKHLPRGLFLDEGALDAAKRGLSPEEYQAELEEIKAKQEADRIALEQKLRAEEEEREQQSIIAKENEERLAQEKAERMKKAKVVRKRVLISLLLCGLLCLAAFGGHALYRNISYNKAIETMNAGQYEAAIAMFSKLAGYSDADNKLNECYYLTAKGLFDAGKYEEAIDQFNLAKDFKDPKDDINACHYNIGLKQLDAKDYKAASLTFTALGNYPGSKRMLAMARYGLAVDQFNSKDYINSYQNYTEFYAYNSINMKEPITGLDLDFVPELKKRYSETVISSGSQSDVELVLMILNGLEDKDVEVVELIDKANNRINELKYASANRKLTNGDYVAAVEEFEAIRDYSDSKNKRLEAMYAYVSIEKFKYLYDLGTGDTSFSEYLKRKKEQKLCYDYAKELADNQYEDSKQVYSDLISWKVSIVMNNSEEDDKNSLTSMSKQDITYAHVKLYGGPFDGETKLRYVFTMSDGGTVKGTWDFTLSSGSSTWCSCYYEQPDYAPTGTCKVRIYEVSSGKLLGEDQIRITR